MSYVRRLGAVAGLDGQSDRLLLQRFVAGREEAAFEALVRRHGRLVWGVCLRVLGHSEDAEDAFQATFLALARKAGAVRWRESVDGWLHTVAHQLASKARVARARRQVRETRCAQMREVDPGGSPREGELAAALDEELRRLPEVYRSPLVLCYLEGLTRDQAARRLRVSVRGLDRRLARGRERLRAALSRRGLALGMALLLAALESGTVRAEVPAALVATAARAARPLAAAGLSGQAVELAAEALGTGVGGKGKVLLALLVVAALSLGGWALSRPPAEPPASPEEGGRPGAAADPGAPAKGADPAQARADLHGDPLPTGALARLGTMRLRHNLGVSSIVFTRDGKGLLTAGGDNLPRLWDAATGQMVRKFTAIPPPEIRGNSACEVFGAQLSPDGCTVAARSGEKCSLYLLETATGKLLHEFKCKHGYATNRSSLNFDFAPDSKAIAAALDGRLGVWDVSTGKERWAKEEATLVGVAFSPDGKTLASASAAGGARLWDARTGDPLRELGPRRPISRIAFAPDGRTLAVGYEPVKDRMSWDVLLLDVATGKELRQLGGLSGPRLAFPAFSPDGKLVATSGGEGIILWEAATGKEVRRCRGSRFLWGPVAFSPDGKALAAIAGSVVRFWDVESGEVSPARLPSGHESAVRLVAFTPDGATLVSGSSDNTVRVWDARTGRERQVFKEAVAHPWTWPTPVAVSPDGRTLARICVEPAEGDEQPKSSHEALQTTIRLSDLATGRQVRRWQIAKGVAGDVLAFSPDGELLATSSFGKDGSSKVHLWEAGTGKHRDHTFGGRSPVFSPDGAVLITLDGATGQVLNFWEVAPGKLLRTVTTADAVQCLALAPDGQTLATGSDEVLLYPVRLDARKGISLGEPRAVAPRPGWAVQVLAFSPDGRLLAFGGPDQAVHVAEAASVKERARFEGHNGGAPSTITGGVMALSFSPDGRRLATGGPESTILIWDVTGRVRDGRLQAPAFSEKEREGLWTDLADADAGRAGRAVWSLVATGAEAVPLLEKRLRPAVCPASPEAIARLIADLDADDFDTRQRARAELKKLGDFGEPAMRQALAKGPSPEVRRSLEELLSAVGEARKTPSREVLRVVRAVEVLEQVGTAEARRVLEVWSGGSQGGRLTAEARAALRRLGPSRPR
jgi:RNA polymerase sigma factor (sigma-70 family)